MDGKLFSDLMSSAEQAVKIERGEIEAENITVFETPDVKKIREKLGITRKQFAEDLGLPEELVKSWEQKKRNPVGLEREALEAIEENPDYYWILKNVNCLG